MENLTYSNYQQFKKVLDTVIKRTVEDFVIIGYLLNEAATTDILLESGYANVNEMAEKEYKLDASQTSRFINIYREFGVENQPMLQEKYKEHGVAKLGLMLTMPEYVRDEISAEYSKREIGEVKKMVEEEKKISDVEVMCEEKSTLQQLLPEGLKQVVLQFVKDYPQEYLKIYDAITLDDVKEIMAPNEVATYKIRIPGVGLNLMFIKVNENIAVTNVRTGEKSTYEWEDFFKAVQDYIILGHDAKENWSNVFQEPFPEEKEPIKSENNNVQQVKQTTKKESKVKTPAPKKKPEPKVEEPVKEVEEQLPGQDSILNHPEYLPEDMQTEVLTGEVEDIKETPNPDKDNVQQSSDDFKLQEIAPVQSVGREQAIASLKNMVKASIHVMHDLVEKEDWSMVISKATVVVHNVKKIQDLEEGK